MSKKIDERIPNTVGAGKLPGYPAVASPWGRLISYHEAAHISQRNIAVISAAIMQAYRILIPDYEERSKYLCEAAYNRMYGTFHSPIGKMVGIDTNNVHPFMKGNFPGALNGDSGDEALLMCGRVNDFGTYRVEKELDTCPWDIIGTELCRATTSSLQGVCDGEEAHKKAGPKVDLQMVEARGAGDLHCRIVGENRDKYPLPAHESWQRFGPIATADQIKFTPEEEMLKESQFFREECEYRFNNGTCAEFDAGNWFRPSASGGGCCYFFPTFDVLIKNGTLDEKMVDHVITCVCEAAGKAYFGGFFAIDALRSFMDVPRDVNDGRIMGGFLEVTLQCQAVPYEVEAFNKDEVILRVNRGALHQRMPRFITAFLSLWYGMTKTLVGAQWSLWEEQGDAPEDVLRIKIAKKIDKFC